MKAIFSLLLIILVTSQSCRSSAYLGSQKDVLKEYCSQFLEKNHIDSPKEISGLDFSIATEVLNVDSNDKENNAYVIAILLHTYYLHLECCNQSFNLISSAGIIKEFNPLLYQFNKNNDMISLDDKYESIPSSIAYYWVVDNSDLLENTFIKSEFDKIKSIMKKRGVVGDRPTIFKK